MTETYIIVGAGHAAGQAATSLRSEGFEGRIIIIGDEPYHPYQRPPLSKKFMAKEIGIDRVYFTPPEFYEKNDIELKLGTTVTTINRDNKTVTLEGGEELDYDKLLITTGSRVRKLSIPGSDLDGIHYLRSIDDVLAIQNEFKDGAKLVVVGGGYIGLEVAAVAAKHGINVTVLEMAPLVMNRVVDPQISKFYESVHVEEGVNVCTNAAVSGFDGNGKVERVLCGDDPAIEADFVVVGVGIVPNIELAEASGLKIDNGIVVDEYCRTEDPNVFSAGDCTNHPNALLGRRLRLESVQNAIEQGKTAAAAMCGRLEPYSQVPWFWSDQYDLKLQIAGMSGDHDDVVLRGDPKTRSFAAFYLRKGELIAVNAINRAPEFMMAKRLIADHAKVSPEKLADENVKMRDIASK